MKMKMEMEMEMKMLVAYYQGVIIISPGWSIIQHNTIQYNTIYIIPKKKKTQTFPLQS